jgi:hypothetical protein
LVIVGGGKQIPLHDLWNAVFRAIKDSEPPTDLVILDEHRLGELPSRWPRSQGWFQARSLASWNDAVDRLGVPAWDTEMTLSYGGGIADTFSIEHYPLFLSRDGAVYCDPARPTPGGTHAEWRASYRSAADVPGAWSAKWMPYGTYYPRQEVADALANLIAIHNLDPGL